jgi:hypothetical protein
MKSTKEYSFVILTFLSIFILRYILGEQVSQKYGELFYLIAIGILLFILFIMSKKRYSNMSIFFLLSFMLLGILPYFHYLNYSNNKGNYTFNNDYLEQNVKNYKEELNNYKDSILISEIKSKLDKSNTNIIINETLINTIQTLDEYTFILKKEKTIPYEIFLFSKTKKPGRPNDRAEAIINVYKKNQELATLVISSNNLKTDINSYLSEQKMLNTKIKNPKEFIPFNDIWLDSVTGFIFSFIKPFSKAAQIIRLLQLITAYFLFHMISKWINLSKHLNITKLED